MNPFNEKEFLGEFIDRLRELPVLWATTDPNHRNKELRTAVLNSLLPFVHATMPHVTAEQLDTKIRTLRGTYRAARNKVLASQRSGAAAGKVFVPKLWYYGRMSFLDDHLESRESLSSLPPRQPSRKSSKKSTSLPSSQASSQASSLPCSQADPSQGEPSQEQDEPSILEEDPDLAVWSQV